MKNPVFMAEAGHLLAGCLVPLLFLFIGGPRWARRGIVLFVIYAVAKEYIIDIHFESNETYGSSTIDLAFYMIGVVLMLAVVRIRRFVVAVQEED